MAHALKSELGISAASLRIIADARLREFDALWKAGQYHTAVYMAGYALEEYLKCAICKTLKIQQLPKVFEYHDLESLLFFSGFDQELRADVNVGPSFVQIRSVWKVEMRYEDPGQSGYNDQTCRDVDKCLNDHLTGLVPWFGSRL